MKAFSALPSHSYDLSSVAKDCLFGADFSRQNR